MYQVVAMAATMHISSEGSVHGPSENCRMRYAIHQVKHTRNIAALALNCY